MSDELNEAEEKRRAEIIERVRDAIASDFAFAAPEQHNWLKRVRLVERLMWLATDAIEIGLSMARRKKKEANMRHVPQPFTLTGNPEQTLIECPGHVRPIPERDQVTKTLTGKTIGVGVQCKGAGQPLIGGVYCRDADCHRDMRYKLDDPPRPAALRIGSPHDPSRGIFTRGVWVMESGEIVREENDAEFRARIMKTLENVTRYGAVEEPSAKARAESILARTSAAFSFERYGIEEWRKIIAALIERGDSDDEIVNTLHSKEMRWATDAAGGVATAENFLAFSKKKP